MLVLLGVSSLSLAAPGCAPRARLCVATSECATGAACVAGRCQPERPGTRPSIESARRLVFRPVDVAYVKRGETPDDPARGALGVTGDAREGVPAQVALGRDGATLFLRFATDVPPSAKIVEAYLVLRRAALVDDDPAPTLLHATRIVAPWNGRSTSFARQPRLEDVGAPATTVEPGGPSLVRLDVRELVRLWARRDPDDHGVAVVGQSESATGTTFALAPASGGAYLELYVR